MNRETIYVALLNLLSAATGIKIDSRRIRLWTDVAPTDKPALFIRQNQDSYVQSRGVPAKITLSCDVFIYLNVAKDPNTVPATALNALLDAVDTAILPDNLVENVQTLGGLVSHCWIEGSTTLDAGEIDGDGIAILPIKILTNH